MCVKGRRVTSRARVACVVLALLLACARDGRAEALDAVLYRIFLTDGSSLVSYGEYPRVGDDVVFSLPIRADLRNPRLHLVSIPAATIDWHTTERYAESARSEHYVATRGESDFALMSSEVAYALNDVAVTADPFLRLEIARQARTTLHAWPRDHYGYRSSDVQQIVGLLDEVISEIRVATGEQRFDLDFVAISSSPPPMPLLPPPSLQETIAQTLGAARLTRVPAERVSLLRAAMGLLNDSAAALPSPWVNTTRVLVTAEIDAELSIERAYADLTRRLLDDSERRAAKADVRGLERLRRDIQARDAALGRKRPNQFRALVLVLNDRLAAARRLRLERDRWNLRIQTFRVYQRALTAPVNWFVRSKAGLEEIRALAGPDADVLERLGRDLQTAERLLQASTPPVEFQSIHDLMVRAVQLAHTSVRFRQDAIRSNDMGTALDASAAASGALMLFTKSQGDLGRQLRAPALR